MPELPEVETIRKDLSDNILNKTISKIEIRDDKIVKNSNALFFKYVEKNKFIKIDRIGKLLILVLANNKFLLIHLKMTGQLVYQQKNELIAGGHSLSKKSIEEGIGGMLPNKYTRVIFTFSNKSKLFFNDLRKFGYLKIVNNKELELIKQRFGIEPLQDDFTLERFNDSLKGKKTNIKAVLLNQQNIAGIGNIYADEILFASKVRPERRVNTLNKEEKEAIFKNTEKIIKEAIDKRGTTFSNYVDASGKQGNFTNLLKIYGRKGENCLICNNKIEKIKLNGRGTHFCKTCQK